MIETARLLLRRPEAADWPAARDFFLSDRAAGIGGPLSLGRAWRAFAAEIGHWDILGCGMFAVTRKGEGRILALVGPWTPPDWPEPEVGWMILDPAAEGQGIAREAAEAALAHAFGSLGWATAVSYVGEGNARSRALAERLGAWIDPSAQAPEPPPGQAPALVYRHPRPEPARAPDLQAEGAA